MNNHTTSITEAITKLLKSLATHKAVNNRKSKKHTGKINIVAVMVAMNMFTLLIVLMITVMVVSLSS